MHMDTKRFSDWTRWENRNNLENLKEPGVYALAISDKNVAGEPFSWIQEIVYIGMSNALSGLKGRLKQFDNTIIGKTGHGGAERFRHDYPTYEKLVPLLFVAVAPFKCARDLTSPADLITMGDVARAEWECLAEFVKAFGNLPKYNDKKRAPKYRKAANTALPIA